MVDRRAAIVHSSFCPSLHAPRDEDKNYDEKCKSSIVYEFNRVQREKGRQTCRSTAAREWLHQHRPKTALHPLMTDYCDTCKYLTEQLSRQQAILNRLQKSGRRQKRS